jgi:hypothetical protein
MGYRLSINIVRCEGLIYFWEVIIRVDRAGLIILAGLRFASITLFSEGVVEILTIETHPITFPLGIL